MVEYVSFSINLNIMLVTLADNELHYSVHPRQLFLHPRQAFLLVKQHQWRTTSLILVGIG